jgi:hypothetical protein
MRNSIRFITELFLGKKISDPIDPAMIFEKLLDLMPSLGFGST